MTTRDEGAARGPELSQIESELERFPSYVLDKYRAALEEMENRLRDQDLIDWANHALAIAGKSVRSWEAAGEYLDASPAVQRQLPSGQFLRWASTGGRLCDDSPSLAAAFFSASPEALKRLRPRYVEDWANLGRSLYRGTWKSSNLACNFFASTPALLESLSFTEFSRFAEFLNVLSRRSYDMADDSLQRGARLFPRIGDERDTLIGVAGALAETSWREVKSLFDAASTALPALDGTLRSRVLTISRRLIGMGHTSIGEFISSSANALNHVPVDFRPRLLDLAEQALPLSPDSVPVLISQTPSILERLSPSQFEEWHREGLAMMEESPESGPGYFRLDSTRSRELLDQLSSGVELSRVKEVLRAYCRALSDTDVDISTTQHLVDKNIGWTDGMNATTEGTTIYLPPVADQFPNKDENFEWYKVIATHQSGYLEFGSFRFDFDRPSTMFHDVRPELPGDTRSVKRLANGDGEASDEGSAEDIEHRSATSIGRFLDLFSDRRLALDIFTVVEDARLDARLLDEYRGLAEAYGRAQETALEQRPRIEDLPMREALLEFIVRLSLRQREGLRMPKDYQEIALRISRLVKRLNRPSASVEDSAEVTARIYTLIAEIPNNEVPEDEYEDMDLDEDDLDQEEEEEQEQDFQQMIQMLSGDGEGDMQSSPDSQEEGEEGEGEESYESPEGVDYRGEFKPEMAQLLSQTSMDGSEMEGEPQPITQEQLEELLQNSNDLQQEEVEDGEETEMQQQMEEMLQNLMKEMQQRDPENQQFGDSPLVHVPEEGGPLNATEPDTYAYDEWDFRANDYKPRWCLVREKQMTEGEAQFYEDTLQEHASLVREIHRQFELVMPEMYRKVKRLEDGEEFDLDLVIESIIDRRTGNTPSEKVFWRRHKVDRDVAVAFLLDMSASTAEAIDENKKPSDDWGAPDDPVEYMVWLRSRRAEGLRRSYKRIIDIEKEGISLLVNALELTGDTYGIYGFSGYGRENVEFYVIKDLEERWGSQIPKRIDRIAPLHATRMGPAIRHATSKLAAAEAKSKILFLISDGRPQDRGYSREGVEKEYAVHDTRVALDEARRLEIQPFCLTVDKNGHDYLKTMMQDYSYEVLSDIRLLPNRLPQLYKKLTNA